MDRLFLRLCKALMLTGGAGVMALMLNVTLDVGSKLLWNAPIQGTIEVSSYYWMVAIVMLPMAFVEYNDEQISVDLAYNLFPGWLKRASLVLTCLGAAAMLSVMTWRTGLDAVRAYRVQEVVMGSREIIVWPARVMLPLGFGLAAFAASLRCVMALRGRAVVRGVDNSGAT